MTKQATTEAQLSEPQIKMRSPGDVIALVPYLLGFHPTESLVVLVLVDGQVKLTTRVDVVACFMPEYLAGLAQMLRERFQSPEFILVGFSADRQLADDCLGLAEIAFGAQLVVESIAADGERYWSRSCADLRCCPAEGNSYPSSNSAILAEAVGAGLAALPSRSQIDAQVRPLSPTQQAAARDEVLRVREELVELNFEQRLEQLTRLVTDDSVDVEASQLIVLGLLVQEVKLRDWAWLRMERSSAQRQVQLWTSVARQLPDEEVLPAICLAGMAAWLSGNGALHVACILRGQSIDPEYSMLKLLEALNLTAADPSIWDRMADVDLGF